MARWGPLCGVEIVRLHFVLFRFSRYEPTKLAKCLVDIGWEEVGAIPFGGDHSLRLYCKTA